MTLIRALSLLGGALMVLGLGTGTAVAGEWYLGGFVGGAFVLEDDMKGQERFHSSNGGTTTTIIENAAAQDVQIDSSIAGGVKAGVCPRILTFFCAEVEFDHFQPKIGRQSRAATGGFVELENGSEVASGSIDAVEFVDGIDFTVWNIGVNVLGRLPLLKEAGYPAGGRAHLYLGGGPTFVWTNGENLRCIELAGQDRCDFMDDTDFNIGVQAIAGVKFFITKNLSVFGEYKFKHWEADFASSTISGTSGDTTETFKEEITDVDFNVNLFYLGLAYHFNVE